MSYTDGEGTWMEEPAEVETIGQLHDRLPVDVWVNLPEYGLQVKRVPSPGGEAARVAPPNDLAVDQWRVRHPGIGVLTYPDETSARAAAGTAGVVYPPGESHRDTS